MSSIVKISCQKGTFVDKECLEEVLKDMEYANRLKVIKNNNGSYSLELSTRGDSMESNKLSKILKEKLEQIMPEIHKNYVIKIAIRNLLSKGFELVRERQFNKSNERIFEMRENDQLKRMILTVNPDLSVVLDSYGFMEKKCDKFTEPLVKGIAGKMNKTYKISSQRSYANLKKKEKTQSQQKLRLGRNDN